MHNYLIAERSHRTMHHRMILGIALMGNISYKAAAVLLAAVQMAYADVSVTTTDGRTVVLKDDGTFEIESADLLPSDEYIELLPSFFEAHTSEYQQESIRFVPIMRNVSDSAIVGVRFKAEFSDAFGGVVFQFAGDTSEKIPAGSASTNNVFYVFENNPFITGESYDKLLPMLAGKTGRVVIAVTGIAFENGKILSF